MYFKERWLTRLGPSRTLFVGKHGLEQAKQAIIAYKTGQTNEMTPELWHAKKIVDSTLHPGMTPTRPHNKPVLTLRMPWAYTCV